MYTEVLLMLQGCPNSLSGGNSDENSENFTIDPNLADLCHPGEIQLLEQLQKFGMSYRKLKKFTKEFGFKTLLSNLNKNSDNSENYGLYLSAFCDGMLECLKPYEEIILETEIELEEKESLGLQHILFKIQPYRLVLDSLCSTVDDVLRIQPKGCELLRLVYNKYEQGPAIVSQAFGQILRCCHLIFCKQLTIWLGLGRINDCYSEFFVQPSSIDNQSLDPWNRFGIRQDLLPSYISQEIAENILFSGHAVLILSDLSNINFDERERVKNIGKNLLEIFDTSTNFDPVLLQKFVTKTKMEDAEKLWNFICGPESIEIMSEMINIKDFLFLGKGELFLSFIDISSPLLTEIPNHNSLYKLRFGFSEAVRSLYLNDKKYERFSVRLKENKEKTPNKSKTCLDLLELDIKIDKPMDLIFTPKLINEGQRIFGFLFKVRFVQLNLDRLWLGSLKNEALLNKPIVCQRVWNLRSKMAFLIDNYQNYLHVDVLESLYSKCIKQLSACNDFDFAFKLVSELFQSISDYCCLNIVSFNQYLIQILDTCQKYCDLIENEKEFGQGFSTKLQQIFVLFDKQTALLFQIIKKTSSKGDKHSFLRQLMLRLDFNGYYGRSTVF